MGTKRAKKRSRTRASTSTSTKKRSTGATRAGARQSGGRPQGSGAAQAGGAARLLTLGEVASAAGVSIPTAQSYKKKYQNRLPSVGSGRTQRYRPEAIEVFRILREENRTRRGRGGSQTGSGGVLSLAEIGRRTKISYPTLLRYLRIHGKAIPSVGSGRTRRFPSNALAVFERLRSESRGGRKPAGASFANGRTAIGADSALAERIRRIESMQADLAQQLDEVVRLLKQPLQVTIRPG